MIRKLILLIAILCTTLPVCAETYTIDEEYKKCSNDMECILFDSSCCGGCTVTDAVNQEHLNELKIEKEERCKDHGICPMVECLPISFKAYCDEENYCDVSCKGEVEYVKAYGCKEAQNKVQIYTVKKIINGNTIVVRDRKKSETVSLIDVDVPKSNFKDRDLKTYKPSVEELDEAERFGVDFTLLPMMAQKSAEFVRSLGVEGKEVRLEFDEQQRDKDERLLAHVWYEMTPNSHLKDMIWADYYVVDVKKWKNKQGYYGTFVNLNATIIKAGYAQPIVKSEKLVDQFYCKEDSDCIIAEICCGGRAPMNGKYYEYNKDELLAPCAMRACGGGAVYESPRCEQNKCVGDLK